MIIKTYKLIPQEKEIILEKITKVEYNYIKQIEEYKKEYKRIPTIRQIGAIVGNKSTATTFYTLKQLAKKGYFYNEI